MQKRFLIAVVVIALLVVAVGCSKKAEAPSQEVLDTPSSDASDSMLGDVNELNTLDEEVQVEELEINPDELSGLDF